MSIKKALRVGLCGTMLLFGAFGGMPVTPEQIEETLSAHNKTCVQMVLEKRTRGDKGDPPDDSRVER